jgi:hypothetical protein
VRSQRKDAGQEFIPSLLMRPIPIDVKTSGQKKWDTGTIVNLLVPTSTSRGQLQFAHILITATFTTQKAQGEEKKRSMCIHET